MKIEISTYFALVIRIMLIKDIVLSNFSSKPFSIDSKSALENECLLNSCKIPLFCGPLL